MNEWILRVCAIGLITSIVLLILPEGKMAKFIKGIFSVLIAVSIISPVLNIDLAEVDLSWNSSEVVTETDENYLNFIYDKKIEKNIEDVENILLSLGISGTQVNIAYNVEENYKLNVDKVYINLQNAVINSNKSHIDIIKEAKSIVAKYFSLKEEVIVINE